MLRKRQGRVELLERHFHLREQVQAWSVLGMGLDFRFESRPRSLPVAGMDQGRGVGGSVHASAGAGKASREDRRIAQRRQKQAYDCGGR